MNDKFNLKQECIFVSLASYANDILTKNDIYAFNGEAIFMAKAIETHFKKKVKRYSKNRMVKLENYLNDVMGPAFPDKMNAAIIMAASLHYLLSEDHYETKVVFSHFKHKVKYIIDILEKSEDKDELKKANETLIKMLNGTPSNFKTNIDKEQIVLNQMNLISLLKNIILDIGEVKNNHKKSLDKINNLLNIYTNDLDLPIIEIEKQNLDYTDKLYFIVSIINKLKCFTTNKLVIINKFKKINLNYLTPNKILLENCNKIINEILL